MEGQCKSYSCNTATQTLDWIEAIINFLHPYRFLFETHVVDFFKDQLWEAVDKEWIESLCSDPIEHLLQIPSGIVQDDWPDSLKEFVLTSRSLAFPREQVKLQDMLPGGIHASPLSLNTVLAQGMNAKKKHEVEVLAAVVSSIVTCVAADIVVDVGAGQGYLAQVLSFQYGLPVVAIDASYHHGAVTKARAERIKKHYECKFRKSAAGSRGLSMPRMVTCRVLSSSTLRNMANLGCENPIPENPRIIPSEVKCPDDPSHGKPDMERLHLASNDADAYGSPTVVLAGLHACGDLSATMLRAFIECEDVKAVISVGCCYNLLSEEGCHDDSTSDCGFPMSRGVKSMGLTLGKNARDLACQSAERWRSLEEEDAVQNFDLHGFRALFQVVLHKYYPEVVLTSPSIGRQGKALRRQEQRRKRHDLLDLKEKGESESKMEDGYYHDVRPSKPSMGRAQQDEKFRLFEKFYESGLSRLGLEPPKKGIELHVIWEGYEQSAQMVGPYWSLRAALGPVLETLVLLDRVLFIQEHCGSDGAEIVPIFDPVLSPRNLAIIARKIW